MSKKQIEKDVLTLATERVEKIFDSFDKVYLSFSGGKDSSVMLHIVAKEAIKRNRKFGLLIIDLEAQYKFTIEHIYDMIEEYKESIELFWVALPISLRNAVSVYEPKWICWEENKKNIWVRQQNEKMITDINYFPFFRVGMEFEEFTPKFAEWYSDGLPCACFIGIRADESLNRYRTIASNKKKKFCDYIWTTRLYENDIYNCYPIYDWATRDIWIYNQKFKKKYNKLYDRMHQAGLSISQQRICQPYGDDQRKGLWLYHIIESDTWAKVVARVSGVNSGAEFVQYAGTISGQIRITKPDSHTWKSFCDVILESMPTKTKEHYKNKIHVFLRWYEEKGYRNGIPDEADPKLEASHKEPSWRRIAKMILRNDYWAKGLSFTQTKHGYFYERYLKRIKKERESLCKKI